MKKEIKIGIIIGVVVSIICIFIIEPARNLTFYLLKNIFISNSIEQLTLDKATLQPLKINNKEDFNNFRLDFTILNSGNTSLEIIRNTIYMVDLVNYKYEGKSVEIDPIIIDPNKLYRPFVTDIEKEIIKGYNHFILMVEYINQKTKEEKVECFFTKTIKSNLYKHAYSKDLSFVTKDEKKLLVKFLKDLIDYKKIDNKNLKKYLNT